MKNTQERHQRQLAIMRGWLEGRSYYVALDALEVCRQLEQGTRKDGQTPKFDHQLSVAQLIGSLSPHLMYPEDTIAAAFLHDILEDHWATWPRSAIEKRFGPRIAEAVFLLSKKSAGFTKTPNHYFTEMAGNPIASLVKASDRVHNLQTMQGVFSPDKQAAYIREVEDRFYPMIRTARRRFPSQYGAYGNLQIFLLCQCDLLEHIIEAAQGGGNG